MTFPRELLLITFLTSFSCHGLLAAGKVKPKEDPLAQDLANTLKPAGLTAKADPGGIGAAKGQISAALTKMEHSQAAGGPGAEQLVNTAYTRFRPDVGPVHRAALVASLSAMWREARALGCFNEKHQFTGKISQGKNAGVNVTYEYIVPLDKAPEFSKDLANIRLTSPYKARQSDKVSDADLALLTTLNAISREVKGMASLKAIQTRPKTNAVGQTLEEAKRIWEQEMKDDGPAALEKPNIVLKGMLLATPAKSNGNKWQVQAEMQNFSSHATEVELEVLVIGSTHKYRKNYVMIERKQKVQLREGEVTKLSFDTNDKGFYKAKGDDFEKLDPKKERPKSTAHYRGTIFRVSHGKDVCTVTATDDALVSMVTENGGSAYAALPKFYLDVKK